MSIDGWVRVGAMVRQERKRRHQTQAEFGRSAGLSVSLLRDIENGRRSNYDAGTRSIIEYALSIDPGTLEAVVAGARPKRIRDGNLRRLEVVWPYLSPETQALLAELAERLSGR